ncbi:MULTISPECIES: transcriptional regulator [Leptotrichia]|mgnify:FL=1|uniref:Transcriptional regulator n=1 Tax=Leptotrichia alba TaxID=3239304 RepID=A0AB39V358_9FUSO|nr:transcriptional regulator [Leptotrichia shahii]
MNLESKKEMYNILKEKIRDRKLSYKKLSEKMRISESGFNKKINGKYFFTQEEIFLLKKILKLKNSELIQIFF